MEMVHAFLITLFLIVWGQLYSGFEVEAPDYDYSYTNECLQTPMKPQYRGGIIVNPEFDEGLKGWSRFGKARIDHMVAKENNNKYIVASHRNEASDSFSQKFILEKDKLYTLSAWLQVSHGNADIAATFKTATGYKPAGWVTAQVGCWSMLKGGVVPNASGPAELYFESKNSSVDIWADSISLQPFTQEEWKSHQHHGVEKFRKGKVRVQAVDSQGKPVANATVFIRQENGAFPFGTAISKYILSNKDYENWFGSRFKYTTFENEMKWPETEASQGQENYGDPDAMIKLVKNYKVSVRGHNVHWEDPKYQPSWVYSLSAEQLETAAQKRVESLVKRYSGEVIHWDVDNENLHNSFLTGKLGADASAKFFKQVSSIDHHGVPFLNEYNTIEEPGDGEVAPGKYLDKIKEFRSQGYDGLLGIGLQGHFGTPNLAYMRSGLDMLASAKLPMWITELDVKNNSNQTGYFEQVLREAHAYPAIGGIIMWTAWRPWGCYTMCLTDNNFKNLPTGDVVDKLLKEWSKAAITGTTDAEGYFQANLFHGDYQVELGHPAAANYTLLKRFKVVPEEEEKSPKTVHVKIDI